MIATKVIGSAARSREAMAVLLLASPLPLDADALPSPADGGASMAQIALDTGLAGALYVGLAARGGLDGLSQEVREGLEAAFVLNSERNANLLRQMHQIDAMLRDQGIAPVFLKGAAILLAGVYPASGARLLGDLDVLVPPDRIEMAVTAAQAAGYRVMLPEHTSDKYSLRTGAAKWHVAPMTHPDLPGELELHVSFDWKPGCRAMSVEGIRSDAVASKDGGLLRPGNIAMMGMALTHHLRNAPVWAPGPLGVKDCLDLLYLSHADPDLTRHTAAQSRRLAVVLDIADRLFARHGAGRPLGSKPRLDAALASTVGQMLSATRLVAPLYLALSPRLWYYRLSLMWQSRAYRAYLMSGRSRPEQAPPERDPWQG